MIPKTGERAVFKIRGEIDHHNAEALRTKLKKAIEAGGIREMVIDLSALEFMDSSGIGVLLGRYNELKKKGGALYIKSPRKSVDKLLRISGVYQVIKKINQ